MYKIYVSAVVLLALLSCSGVDGGMGDPRVTFLDKNSYTILTTPLLKVLC